MCVSVCAACTSHIVYLYDMRTFVDDSDPMVMYIQFNLLSKYLEGYTKSVLLIRGTYYPVLVYMVCELGTE